VTAFERGDVARALRLLARHRGGGQHDFHRLLSQPAEDRPAPART
jgi:hypothetical protein